MRTIPAVDLREPVDGDVAIFFEQQDDPVANTVADFPRRDPDAFFGHWARLRAEGRVAIRTIVADGAVAGHLVSWRRPEGRLVGYWLGREFWGRGIATAALQSFVQLKTRSSGCSGSAYSAASAGSSRRKPVFSSTRCEPMLVGAVWANSGRSSKRRDV